MRERELKGGNNDESNLQNGKRLRINEAKREINSLVPSSTNTLTKLLSFLQDRVPSV